jgi:hypothetical protein
VALVVDPVDPVDSLVAEDKTSKTYSVAEIFPISSVAFSVVAVVVHEKALT